MKKRLVKASKGQSLAEYGLILALIAIICIGALTTLGGQISGSLTNMSSALGGAMGGGGGGAAPAPPAAP